MRVFVTGASGHIGSALVPELIGAGHEVVGLARSDESAAALTALGAEVQRGDLDDLDGLRRGRRGVGRRRPPRLQARPGLRAGPRRLRAGRGSSTCAPSRRSARRSRDRTSRSSTTSGTLLLAMAAPGRVGTEADTLEGGPRIDSENATIALADRGVRSSVVRLAPLVHSSLDHHGFTHQLIAHRPPDGRRRLRRRRIEPVAGAAHARRRRASTASRSSRPRQARACTASATRASLPPDRGGHRAATSTSRRVDRARGRRGAASGRWLGSSCWTTRRRTRWTREVLGWAPTHAGLIEDLEEGHYFAEVAA